LPDGELCYVFFDAGFSIKNIPTPAYIIEGAGPITVQFINGTGEARGDVIHEATFEFELTPEAITDFSYYLSEAVVYDDPDDLTTARTTNAVDVVFVPQTNVFN
jgi:hypothetical protein